MMARYDEASALVDTFEQAHIEFNQAAASHGPSSAVTAAAWTRRQQARSALAGAVWAGLEARENR